ncbi:MAG: CHAT domain-containing tetratricopeptide repeat protein [Cyanobacteria bacterium P01_H01_bin.152]
MRYPVKLLSLATFAALLLPTAELSASQPLIQHPSSSEVARSLLSQTEPIGNVLLEVEGVLEKGDLQANNGSLYDAYMFEGQAGQSVTIRLESQDFDTYLFFFDINGEQLASNDDSGENTNSQLSVTLTNEGTYQIFANAFDETGRGQYRLTVTEANPLEIRQAEADRLYERGVREFNASQYQNAQTSLQAALEIYQEIANRHGEGETLNILGVLFQIAGQPRNAIELLEQAVAIAEEIGDRQMQGAAIGNLGIVYRNLGEYEQAIEYYSDLLVISREVRDRRGESLALGNLGNANRDLSQYDAAIEFYEQALEISQEIGDSRSEGRSLVNLGFIYSSLGQHEQAIGLYQQSIAIFHEIGDRQGEGGALAGLGSTYDSVGRYEQAIDLHEQALAISREIGDRQSEGEALGGLGIAHDNLGQYEQAIEFYQQQIAIFRKIGDRSGEGAALGDLAITYDNLGQYAQAIDLYEQQFVIAREIGDRSEEGRALGNLGVLYTNLGQIEQAVNLNEQQLTIAREIGDRSGEGVALENLGSAYLGLGEYEKSIIFYEQSLAISREVGDRDLEGITLHNQGLSLTATEQFPQAELVFRQSIELFESLRIGLSDAQLISIADTQANAYASLELALTAQDKTAEALAITERGRGRAFVLQLASRLATEEERAALEASPVAQVPTIAEIQQIARDTNTTLVTYSLVFDQALYIWVVQPSGDIEFRSVEFEGGEGGQVINPIASIDGPVYRSVSSDSALTVLVSDSRSAVNAGGNPNTPELQELHDVLIDPIADLLPDDPNAQVAFIPQGELFLVPFAALQDDNGTYLIEKHTILTAPSIQVFGLANDSVRAQGLAPLPTENALIVGNPTMPTVWLPTDDGFAETQLSYLSGAETEAEAIGEFFNIPVLTGGQATEARIKQELPKASLIHLATHGLLEYGIPESSGVLDVPGAIALAPGNGEDGLLTAAEILQMDLQAELAILSACDTGRGRITGDGVVGLSRALITAGVPSVMVSLWAVNDDSTSILMQRFYQFLATGEFTKAEALRQAQLSLLYDEDMETRLDAVRAGAPPQYREGFEPAGNRHPYHWAPFVLIGNGQ